MSGVSCNHDESCITCGDIALPLTVVSVRPDGLARCEHETGGFEEVDVSLVEPVAAGDTVLVHARVALSRVNP